MTDQIQELYNKAFAQWEAGEKEAAAKTITEALRLSPEDTALHELAFHIKKGSLDFGELIPHLEFLVEQDFYCTDKINSAQKGRLYIDLLLNISNLYWQNLEMELEVDRTKNASQVSAAISKFQEYTLKALQAGLEVSHLYSYINTLKKQEKYDPIIDIAFYLAGEKSAQELGLPGLDKCDFEDDDLWELGFEDIIEAFFLSGRTRDALGCCLRLMQKNPDDWQLNYFLGELYARLDRPDKTLTQWIIAVRKGADEHSLPISYEDFLKLTTDPGAHEKDILHDRLTECAVQIPEELKEEYRAIKTALYRSIGNPAEKLTEAKSLEEKLNIQLPPVRKKDYLSPSRHYWVPSLHGPHPYIDFNASPAGAPGETPGKVISKTAALKPVTIERYGMDLTAQAAAGLLVPIVGREAETEALIRILVRLEKNNPVLLGEAGVGKTAVVQGLALKIAAGEVPGCLRGSRIIELSMNSLVSGTIWRGDFEKRMTSLIDEARENRDIILFIDEIHTMIGAGSAARSDLDAANIVKPALAKGELRLIGATTSNEYIRYIEKDQAMARRFTPVRLLELDRRTTLEVLKKRRSVWLSYHQVEIPDEVLDYTVELTDHYLLHRKFPDKAIDLLDETCAHLKTSAQGPAVMSTADVYRVFLEWKGSAPVKTGPEHSREFPRLLQIKEALGKELLAQEKVVETLSELVILLRLSLKTPGCPLSLLFYGPGGSGKTTAVTALARILWPDDKDRIMSINLAEYTEPGALSGLIGAPQGFSGHEEGGILSARIKRQNYSIVLLKNPDRCHPAILGFFTDLLKKGFFMDSLGNLIHTGDVLFIFLLDSPEKKPLLGYSHPNPGPGSSNPDKLRHILERQGIPAELVHNLTYVLEFNPLSQEELGQIFFARLEQFKKAYLEKGFELSLEKTLAETLAAEYLDLPLEQRNIELFFERRLTPLVREALLAKGGMYRGRLHLG